MSRPTRIRSIDRDDPDPRLIDEAAEVIRSGGLVAFATETVYGLGADATDARAVARIFAAKGRPSHNPLIVHVTDAAMARRFAADWPEAAETLAAAFWPGPLTIVLPRARTIPDEVTAGLNTVGLRAPATAVANRLIAAADRPIAAPSANRSNGVSPTLAQHVRDDLDGRIDMILDSGPTRLGIESTVVDLTTRHPRILRPGPITLPSIEHALGSLRVHEAGDEGGPLASPGRLPVHYAPRTEAVWVEPHELEHYPWVDGTALLVFGAFEPIELPAHLTMRFLQDPTEAEAKLYLVLRRIDAMQLRRIVVVPPPDTVEWRAVRDRLRRATTRHAPPKA